VGKPEAELASALDRLVTAGLLFRHGLPPQAAYLFKHALLQDAAYGTLLREQRRALHARIAEALESQFAEIAESQPELLAHHCTEAAQIEKAAIRWGKAGQLSLARSALVEAAEQLTRALTQIATLPGTRALRHEQIKLQLALATALMHINGYAALETRTALDQARLYIDRAEALGEAPEDPMLLISALYGSWNSNYVAFNGRMILEIAGQVLALAARQTAKLPLIIGRRLMGVSLLAIGDIAKARAHFDEMIAVYDPAEYRSPAVPLALAGRVTLFAYRSKTLWLLGYPDRALADSDRALKEAREIGQAGTLLYALVMRSSNLTDCGNYAAATAENDEFVALAEEKGASYWKALGMIKRGCMLVLTGKASDAVQLLVSGISAYRSTGSTLWAPSFLSYLARAYVAVGQFDDAWRCISEALAAVQTTMEGWYEAEIHRIGGEIALMGSEPDAKKAEAYFERALTVACEQQAKSWELRAATSMARHWRDQGKRQQAHDLLAPVYGWFTEGFDTLDLKEAKSLLEQLKA